MKKSTAVLVTVALAAGGTVALTAPATAAGLPPGSQTTITLPGTEVDAMVSEGLGLFAISPAVTASAAGQDAKTWGVSTGFTFPVTKITKKGVIRHEGAMVFTNGPKARTVVVSSPRLEQSTKTITAVVSGVDPSLDGKRLPIMVVKKLKSRATKKYQAKTKGRVFLNPALAVGDVLNAALDTKVFSNGQPVGRLVSVLP
jgi:hypothetical protein